MWERLRMPQTGETEYITLLTDANADIVRVDIAVSVRCFVEAFQTSENLVEYDQHSL